MDFEEYLNTTTPMMDPSILQFQEQMLGDIMCMQYPHIGLLPRRVGLTTVINFYLAHRFLEGTKYNDPLEVFLLNIPQSVASTCYTDGIILPLKVLMGNRLNERVCGDTQISINHLFNTVLDIGECVSQYKSNVHVVQSPTMIPYLYGKTLSNTITIKFDYKNLKDKCLFDDLRACFSSRGYHQVISNDNKY